MIISHILSGVIIALVFMHAIRIMIYLDTNITSFNKPDKSKPKTARFRIICETKDDSR